PAFRQARSRHPTKEETLMNISKITPWILVLGVSAIAPVMNGCHTNQSARSQVNDSAITAAVKSKMIADNDVKAHNIDVNTEDGVVYLMGRVETAAEKSEAERLARGCDGVRSVVNHLQVGN
ncbi:MAG: BON domain-containing protein, partial [Planctomycetota bacterium]